MVMNFIVVNICFRVSKGLTPYHRFTTHTPKLNKIINNSQQQRVGHLWSHV